MASVTPKPKTDVIFDMFHPQSSVAIEIPVRNPEGELLMLNVYLEGDNLNGASVILIPPRETLTYKATFSPDRVGKSTGR